MCQKNNIQFSIFVAKIINKAQQKKQNKTKQKNTLLVKSIIFRCKKIFRWYHSMVRCKSYGPLSDEWYKLSGHFHHYYKSHVSSLSFVTVIYYHKYTFIYGKLGLIFYFPLSGWLKVQKQELSEPSSTKFRVLKNWIAIIWGSWPNFTHKRNWTFLQFWGFEIHFFPQILNFRRMKDLGVLSS